MFRKVGSHSAAQRACPTGHYVGGVRRQFGGERFGQLGAEAKTGKVRLATADCDLVLGLAGQDVIADAVGDLGEFAGVIDVDEAAPTIGEFLVTDDPAESPEGSLVDRD